MDIEERTIAKLETPWQVGLVQVVEKADGQILQKYLLILKARGCYAEKGSQAGKEEGQV